MQAITGKRYFEAQRYSTLRELLNHCAVIYADSPAYRYHEKPGGTEIVRTYREYVETIDAFGTGLMNLGLHGQHIGIVGHNCYEWAISHNAIVNGVGVSVPMDRQLPQAEVIHLCERGQVKVLIYQALHHDIARAVAAINSDIRFFICMQDGIISQTEEAADNRFIEFSSILEKGRNDLSAGDRSFIDASIDPEAMISLLFTSGTGKMPKGVMLCHRNITHNIYAVMGTLDVHEGQNALSVLPLHHTFENTVGMYMIQAYGCCICFSDGLRHFTENLAEWKIDILLAVPLVFETTYKQIMRKLERNGQSVKVKYMRTFTRLLRSAGLDIRRSVFRPILGALGGHLKLCVCGAAAIDPQIVRFYNEIGVDFFCGYGLTETSPVISVCSTFVNIYGSVGAPVADIEVAIDTPGTQRGSVGEIMTRSDSVMLGYYQNPDETSAVMTDDGWFRTGDLGYLDKHDSIFITGRIKSMIVLNNGKKAFPEEIEVLLNQISGIKESIVWGESSPRGAVDICAKLVVEPRKLPQDLADQPDRIAAYLAEQLSAVNKSMPPYKEIKYFVISKSELIKTDGTTIRRAAEHEHIRKLLAEKRLNPQQADGQWID